MPTCTATLYPSLGRTGASSGPVVPSGCLQCSIRTNLCVSYVPALRLPDEINAAHLVCGSKLGLIPQEASMRRKRILIVDNDEDVLIALERVLEQAGYDTVIAWDLPEGLEIIGSKADFDLLLIGDHPPELNCERVLKLLRRKEVKVPCLVMHSTARHPFSEPYLRYLGASGIACKWSDKQVVEEVQKCFASMPAASATVPRDMAAAAGGHN